jgi:hypothetical protein
MKVLNLLLAAAIWLLPAMVVAQSGAQQSGTQSGQASQQSNQSTQTNAGSAQNSGSTRKMSGKVSHNGQSFVNDSDSKSYSVNNPSALQDYENQHVAMIVQVDPDDNVVHIISVAPPQP